MIDYKSGGEVFQHLQRDGGRFEEAKVRFYVAEIIIALEYLHEHGIVYRCVASFCLSSLGPDLTLSVRMQRPQA